MAELARNKDATKTDRRARGGRVGLVPPNQTKSTTESQDLDSRKKERHQIQILRL